MNPDQMQHFEELRRRINERLVELGTPHAREQIEQCPFLYGALGEVPSNVMFICQNPSMAGVAQARVQTIDGGPPDIEAQWWGGPKNPAAKRFRVVLYHLGLKTSPPQERGGWRCYITNVVKEMQTVGVQNAIRQSYQDEQARNWASILAWELGQVSPKQVFAVGGKAQRFLRLLQRERLILEFEITPVQHYAARGSDRRVITQMKNAIEARSIA